VPISRADGVPSEFDDPGSVAVERQRDSEEPDDVVRRAITQHHLRWRPEQDTQPVKVLVLGHDDESVIASMGPDCTVRGSGQADLADMDGTGVQVGERVNKTGRQILDEKQPGWLLRQPDYSRPGAHARQRTLGRRGCRRASAVESRRGSRPPAFRTPGRTGHLRP